MAEAKTKTVVKFTFSGQVDAPEGIKGMAKIDEALDAAREAMAEKLGLKPADIERSDRPQRVLKD